MLVRCQSGACRTAGCQPVRLGDALGSCAGEATCGACVVVFVLWEHVLQGTAMPTLGLSVPADYFDSPLERLKWETAWVIN